MVNFRFASEKDNVQLLKLCSDTGMDGETGLRIDRQPNFFSLLRLRGESTVFVAEENEKILGCVCVSKQNVYVRKEIHSLHYIGDFKVAPGYRNKGIGLQLCNELANYVIADGGDLAFLNVSQGNKKPFSFFKGRPGIPDFQPIGMFTIYQMIGKKNISSHRSLKVEELKLTAELLNFFNSAYEKYELGPHIEPASFQPNDRFFLIRKNGQLAAAMCLTDLMELKQNVVTRLSPVIRLAIVGLNSLANPFGLSRMPGLQEPVKMMYARYLACLPGEDMAAKTLLNHARKIVYLEGYSFASIGLHEKDPLNACIPGIFKLTFRSVGMLLSIKNNAKLVETIRQGIPFEDYSLV